MKYIKMILLFVLLVLVLFIFTTLLDTNKSSKYIRSVNMENNQNISLKVGDKIKYNIYDGLPNKFGIDKLYKWSSSNDNVAVIENSGIIKAKTPGTSTVSAKLGNKIIKTNVNVYDIKDIIIVVGDSRFDHFKDDNNFIETDNYEVKYKNTVSVLNKVDRIYVVSLSGMRYNWLAGLDEYKDKNANVFVSDIIHEYEEKTSKTVKYNIKIMFNLGVNDLNHRYLLDDKPSNVALKYLNELNKLMENEWSSNIINDISLNIITLFPTDDEMNACYSSLRYNIDVIEFNNTIITNSKYKVCDAYNDLGFRDDFFRERNDKSCASRDGLHFSPEFNRDILYPYLIDCFNK